MNREQKEQSVEELKGLFSSASAGVLVDYQGLSANDLVELRKKLNETQSSMKVLKNTLARIAVKDTPYAELQAQFVRARAMVFSDNPVEQAKVLTEYAEFGSVASVGEAALERGTTRPAPLPDAIFDHPVRPDPQRGARQVRPHPRGDCTKQRVIL